MRVDTDQRIEGEPKAPRQPTRPAGEPAKRGSSRVGIQTKLVRVFILQLLLISLAAIIGVYITYVIVEDVLTQQALNEEAEHYWQLYEADPAQPLPDTANMIGYMASADGSEDAAKLPAGLAGLDAGFARVEAMPGNPLVHVSERGGQRLFLVFAEEEVSTLVFYFGLAPLFAVLLTVYALMLITYRLSTQAISPILAIARSLQQFDFSGNQQLVIPPTPASADTETQAMASALEAFSSRLEHFVERERNFTRDAGHELRTPIAVMRGSLELIASQSEAPPNPAALSRIKRAVSDMETLLETLLMLAREEDMLVAESDTDVNHVIAEQLELHQTLAEAQGNQLIFEDNTTLTCNAKPEAVAIIVGNLVKNALTYTKEGTVTVSLTAQHIIVTDTGIGMSAQEKMQAFTAFYRSPSVRDEHAGQGLGLAIVQRLLRQLGWRITVDSAPGVGSTFTVSLPNA